MKKLLLLLVLVGFTSLSYSQQLIQTYTDRCTGVTQVFQIPMEGSTAVMFYNRSQTFTAADVYSGAFQAWLEETYLWWSTLNPCSAAQAEATTAQQTAQQTTQAATQAATAAASAPPPAPPTTAPPTNASSSTTNTASSSGSTSTSNSQSTNSSSSSSSESTQSKTSDSSGGGESSEPSGGGESSESESSKTEETSSEESNESESEEVKEESESEESESEEESSENSEDSEEEEKEEKKKSLAPPILAANVMTNQMLDGTWSTAASFGISQSSLTGQTTYSANAMVWTNFQQFSLALSKSKVSFWKEQQTHSQVVNSLGQWKTTQGDESKQNQIHHVGSTMFNYMNIFGTNVLTFGYSRVYLGQNDNMFQGAAAGYALTSSFVILPESTLFSPAFTFFGTKPINPRGLPRWSFAPMVAISLTPVQATYEQNNLKVGYNPYFTYIIGSGINFKLTQRFIANIGINTINNTSKNIPTALAFTIGARFQF